MVKPITLRSADNLYTIAYQQLSKSVRHTVVCLVFDEIFDPYGKPEARLANATSKYEHKPFAKTFDRYLRDVSLCL